MSVMKPAPADKNESPGRSSHDRFLRRYISRFYFTMSSDVESRTTNTVENKTKRVFFILG